MKLSYYEIQDTHTETLKEVLKCWTEETCLCGATCVLKYVSKSSLSGKHLIFQTISVCVRYQCQIKLHIAFNEVPYTKIQIAALREGVNRKCSLEFLWWNVTWTVGCAVTCLATGDVTNRHIRTVIWQTKGGFVSNGRQAGPYLRTGPRGPGPGPRRQIFRGGILKKSRLKYYCGKKRLSTKEKFKGDLYWKQCWYRVFSLRCYWR
jgi:hypothetical protein